MACAFYAERNMGWNNTEADGSADVQMSEANGFIKLLCFFGFIGGIYADFRQTL